MDLLAEFQRISLDTLAEFISTMQEENLHLEFKTVSRSDLSRDDRKNLAAGLSGFANSDGGLIVWGVLAKQNAQSIDCAIALHPVASAQALVAKLNEFTGSAVSPIVDGVLHKALAMPDGSGHAVTLVPASDSGPHMAKGGEDRYYKRSGDSFYRMEHFDLEDMFGRRRRPVLTLETTVVYGGSMSSGGSVMYKGRVVISIRNVGRGPAHAPYLALKSNRPYRLDGFGIDGSGVEGLPRLRQAANMEFSAFGGNALVLLHPGTAHDVCALVVDVARGQSELQDLEIEYELACEEVALRRGSLRLSGADVIRLVTNAAA